MVRTLGVLRISILTNESTSLERQKEIIQAAARGELIAWAEDPDVSASKVPPTKRPQLRPWLSEPNKIAQYDEILFWRLDRFVRSVGDFADMIRWCEQHGKNLRSATEDFDLSTPMGKVMAYLIAIFAEMESRAISARVSGTRAFLWKDGRFPGGRVPFGYATAANPDGAGRILAVDEAQRSVVLRIVTGVLGGRSVLSLATELNSEEIPSGLGGKWYGWSILKMLRSRALLGQVEHKGQVVIGDDGMPVQRAEPLVDFPTWEKLQLALAAASRNKSIYRAGGNPLLGILTCWNCGGPRAIQRDRNVTYYRCTAGSTGKNDCGSQLVPAPWVEQALEDTFLHIRGHEMRHERRWLVGESRAEDLQAAVRAYESLTERLQATSSVTVMGVLAKQLNALEGRIAELEANPGRSSGWEDVNTGETWGQAWERSDWPERRKMLLNAGITARVGKINGIFQIELSGGSDVSDDG